MRGWYGGLVLLSSVVLEVVVSALTEALLWVLVAVVAVCVFRVYWDMLRK
mgnify:CR=1 FL=1